MPAPFQAIPAFWMMAAAPRPTRTEPHTILRAERVAVSLNGKKTVGNWVDMDSSTGVLAIVPAEIIDLDILGVEVITLARPRGDVILTMRSLTRDVSLSQDETFTGTLAQAGPV